MRYAPTKKKKKPKKYGYEEAPNRKLKPRNYGVFRLGELIGFPNKVLFLNIEGVLMPIEDFHFDYRPDTLEPPRFIRSMVRELDRILDMTGACMVLTSDMCVEDVEFMQSWFKVFGVKYPERIIGETLDAKTYIQTDAIIEIATGSKIKAWMDGYVDKHPGKIEGHFDYNYAIIDYRTDILFNQRFYYVNTDPDEGLTTEKADEAIDILNRR